MHIHHDLAAFRQLALHHNAIVLMRRLMSDQLTPVLGYRRLVSADDRTAPSFLFESVEGGDRVGRYSFIGAQPALEVTAYGHDVVVTDHRQQTTRRTREVNPLDVMRRIMQGMKAAPVPSLDCFAGGWVGYAAYDVVRYLEAEKLSFADAPRDDRMLPDLHFGLYREVGVFDHVGKVLHAVVWVFLDEHPSIEAAYSSGCDELERFVERMETHSVPLPPGSVSLDVNASPTGFEQSNFGHGGFQAAVDRCKQYIADGDAFQVVLSQRFERDTAADPFEIYRALRIINPSPYMIYLQAAGSILVASSPEILCRVQCGTVTNRPLAGTRRRGRDQAEDAALEQELLADAKERAEHVMLVDLGRNDLGRVCELGSIKLQKVMEVERYSHVMHLSSTVTGVLRRELDAWDALSYTLPVGTVSGAPKVRAMQIIDELEPTKRGPYAGGIGAVGFNGEMDMALALRTMVVPISARRGNRWTVHLQAGAGIVADSDPSAEREETVNKAAALGRAIDLAESSFHEA